MSYILLILGTILLLSIFIAWPQSALYALAFFIPVIAWSFNIHNFNLPFIDLLALLVLVSFILQKIFHFLFRSSQKQKLRWPLFFPFLIFIFFSILSALHSSEISASLWYIIRWPLFLYFAYIFLPDNLINDEKTFKKTLIALFLSSLVVLFSGYLSLYGQDWHNNFYQITSIKCWGIYPFGENHNLIAEFLNIGIFLTLSLKFISKKIRVKRFLNIIFFLEALAIFLTFSRAAWITLILQSIIYSWYYLRSKKYKIKNIIIIASLLALILTPLIWKMGQFQKDNLSSTASRWLLTEISWQAFQNKPYLGYGSGQFINLVNNNIRFIAKYGSPIDSHGFLQKILAENGIFGLAAWLFIIIYLLKIAHQSLKKYNKNNPWLLPLWLAAGGGLFFQVFNTSYYSGKIWFPVALALIAVRLLEEKNEKENKKINKYDSGK